MGPRLARGVIFAGYEIERLLGVGGMGEVYLARDRDLPRSVALKLLASDKADDPEVRARFLREADTAARLSHPNIVAVHARGTDRHRLWMAMQYIEGTDVAAVLREGALRPGHAVRILTETARALDHAHRSGVLHRDVKPANILLAWGPEQRVYLADFGIAKALDQTSGLTRTGEMYASFQYAAPEQFELRTDTDHRADVYALGCTLFHMLTGELPYPGESTAQLVAAHLSGEIPRPSLRNPEVPPGFDQVIARALAKQREHRFDSCGELAAAAERALRTPATGDQDRLHDRPDPDRTVIDGARFTGPATQPSAPVPGPPSFSQDVPASFARDAPTWFAQGAPALSGSGEAASPAGGPVPDIPASFTPRPPASPSAQPTVWRDRSPGAAQTGPHGEYAARPGAAGPAKGRRSRRRLLIASFVAALVLAAALGVGFGSGAVHFSLGASGPDTGPGGAGGDAASRAAAVTAACDYAELMATYDYSDGDGWQAKVIAGATGTWKTQAQTLLPAVRLLLESDSEHTRAVGSTCTVTSGNSTHYELDADITQVNSTQGKADTTDHQKISLSMDYVDGRWLCSRWVSPLFPG